MLLTDFATYETPEKLFLYCVQGSHMVLKVLNCEVAFQDLEKILNLAKMFI